MSTPVLFKDLNKRVNDLLTKEFPVEEKKFEWKGTNVNNVTVETSYVQKGDGAVVGTLIPSYKYKPYGLTLLADVNTKREVKLETTVENQIAAGLKVVATAESKGENSYATLSTEYKHPYASLTTYLDFGKPKGSTIRATSVFGSQGVSLGLSGEYFVGGDNSELKTFQATVAYNTVDFDVAAFGRLIADKDKNEVGGSYFHNVNSALAVGAEVVFDTTNADAKPKLTFGASYKVNDDTVVKEKFDTAGVLSLSFAQKFNKNSKLTIGSSVDTNNLSGKSASTLGFTLSLAY